MHSKLLSTKGTEENHCQNYNQNYTSNHKTRVLKKIEPFPFKGNTIASLYKYANPVWKYKSSKYQSQEPQNQKTKKKSNIYIWWTWIWFKTNPSSTNSNYQDQPRNKKENNTNSVLKIVNRTWKKKRKEA